MCPLLAVSNPWISKRFYRILQLGRGRGWVGPCLVGYFHVLAYGILRKDGLFVTPSLFRRLAYWTNGLFYPSWNRMYRFTAFSSNLEDCQALTWPTQRQHNFLFQELSKNFLQVYHLETLTVGYRHKPFSSGRRYLCSQHRCWQHRLNFCNKIYVANIGIYVVNVQMKRAIFEASSITICFQEKRYICRPGCFKTRRNIFSVINPLAKAF